MPTAQDLVRRFRYKPGWQFELEGIAGYPDAHALVGTDTLCVHAKFRAPDSGFCINGNYPVFTVVNSLLFVTVREDDAPIAFARAFLNEIQRTEVHELREFAKWERDGNFVTPFHPHKSQGEQNWLYPRLAPSGLRL